MSFLAHDIMLKRESLLETLRIEDPSTIMIRFDGNRHDENLIPTRLYHNELKRELAEIRNRIEDLRNNFDISPEVLELKHKSQDRLFLDLLSNHRSYLVVSKLLITEDDVSYILQLPFDDMYIYSAIPDRIYIVLTDDREFAEDLETIDKRDAIRSFVYRANNFLLEIYVRLYSDIYKKVLFANFEPKPLIVNMPRFKVMKLKFSENIEDPSDRSDPSKMFSDPKCSPGSPHYVPGSPHYVPGSPHYVPGSPHYVPSSPHYVPSSPHYVPSSPHYVPSSQFDVPDSRPVNSSEMYDPEYPSL